MLRHFGEHPPETCGNCDNCLEAPGVIAATELARKLLSAVYRTGQRFGVGHLEKVLTGVPDDRIEKFGHDRLSVFGIAESHESALIRPVARALQARGSLIANDHGGLALAGDARTFAHLGRAHALEPGTRFPAPSGIFPRLVDEERPAAKAKR